MPANAYLYPADILLPDFERVNGTVYATVACDQFTSQPEYWEKADAAAGTAPSTLRMILPEIYLSEAESRIPQIHETMEKYIRDVLNTHKNSMIYVERTQSDGKVRRGLVGMVDLEQYDYHRGAKTLIRATEATVEERIPPRLAVRQGAALELPHDMLLIDDPGRTVIEPLTARREELKQLYSFSLAFGGGKITGRLLDSIGLGRVTTALQRLIAPERVKARLGEGAAPILFAVGDGNHSLAAAKAAYEALKTERGEAALSHPARFALVEVVNLYDDALVFEPIHRVLFGVAANDVLSALASYSTKLGGSLPPQQMRVLAGGRQIAMHFEHPVERLTVATLQTFLDRFLSDHPEARVDYIHGHRAVESLARHENTVGFLLQGIRKEQFFRAIAEEGMLPQKTFSMGNAEDKRYYIEARKIR